MKDGSGMIDPAIFNPESEAIGRNLVTFKETLEATNAKINSTLEDPSSAGNWSVTYDEAWDELYKNMNANIERLQTLLDAGRSAAENTVRTDQEVSNPY